MRLDLHVGLAVRARLRRACQCDVARGLNIRRLLERRTLDIDVARLRCAADLDVAVFRVVDVPVARSRADVDGLRLRRLFERELLADVDLVISEVEIVGFDLRVVRGSQIARDRELLAGIHLDVRRLRLEAVDVHLRRDGTILNDSDLHVRLVLELEVAVRHIGGDVFNLVRLRAEIHRAFAEEQQIADRDRRTLGKTVA